MDLSLVGAAAAAECFCFFGCRFRFVFTSVDVSWFARRLSKVPIHLLLRPAIDDCLFDVDKNRTKNWVVHATWWQRGTYANFVHLGWTQFFRGPSVPTSESQRRRQKKILLHLLPSNDPNWLFIHCVVVAKQPEHIVVCRCFAIPINMSRTNITEVLCSMVVAAFAFLLLHFGAKETPNKNEWIRRNNFLHHAAAAVVTVAVCSVCVWRPAKQQLNFVWTKYETAIDRYRQLYGRGAAVKTKQIYFMPKTFANVSGMPVTCIEALIYVVVGVCV